MATNRERPDPFRRRNLRDHVPADNGRSESVTVGGVHVYSRNTRGDKHFLTTEAGWRIASAAFSVGAVVGVTYITIWHEVINR
jgi:hypothetical protein